MAENELKAHFRSIRLLHEAGICLRMKSVPLATAAVIYHKFFRENRLQDYDPHIIIPAAVYLAGKVEEEPVKLRDVVNACYRAIHKNRPPLDIGETYWALRESVATCELFLLRMLKFRVVFNHPHRYLLHYLKSLRDWFDQYQWEKLPIVRNSWSLLRDSYHGALFLSYKPQHIAISVLYLSLQCCGAEVPYNQESDTKWWKVFADDISLNIIMDIIRDVIAIYNLELS